MSSFPVIWETSDEGELSDLDYDYRRDGVVKNLGRTNLDDSDSSEEIGQGLESLEIKLKDTQARVTAPASSSAASPSRHIPTLPIERLPQPSKKNVKRKHLDVTPKVDAVEPKK